MKIGSIPFSTFDHDAKVLELLHQLGSDHIFSKNVIALAKTMLLRRDERLMFIIRRFLAHAIPASGFFKDFNELIIKEGSRLHRCLFELLSLEEAKKISMEGQLRTARSTSLTYGEIEFDSFVSILRRCCCGKDTSKLTFYDLGSGTGRAVLASRLVEDFHRCEGVEVLEELHVASERMIERFNLEFAKYLYWRSHKQVRFHLGSLLEFDWSDGDVVFANSTCFDAKLMEGMSLQAEKLKPGSIFICFTKRLASNEFILLEQVRQQMSWGPATVFVYQRKDNLTEEMITKSILAKESMDSSSERNCGWDKWRQFLLVQCKQSAYDLGATTAIGEDNCMSQTEEFKTSIPRLAESNPSSLRPGQFQEFEFDNPNEMVALDSRFQCLGSLRCLIYAPVGYCSDNFDKAPLLVHLHGGSLRGLPTIDVLKSSSLTKAFLSANDSVGAEAQPPAAVTRFNGLVFMPLCPNGVEWRTPPMCDLLMAALDVVIRAFAVNSRKVYLMGMSMGGLGTWMVAARNPNRFAGIVPLCGGGSPVYARVLKHVPCWFVHGANDNVIPVDQTDNVHNAMISEGSTDVHYTRFDRCDDPCPFEWMIGHNCWDLAFKDSRIWDWLYSKELI